MMPGTKEGTVNGKDDDDLAAVDDDDSLFQCLECTFVGCAPASVVSTGTTTKQHILQHLLQSNHKYGR